MVEFGVAWSLDTLASRLSAAGVLVYSRHRGREDAIPPGACAEPIIGDENGDAPDRGERGPGICKASFAALGDTLFFSNYVTASADWTRQHLEVHTALLPRLKEEDFD